MQKITDIIAPAKTPLLDALVALANLHGKKINADDITAGLPITGGDLASDLIPRALARVALDGRISHRGLPEDHLLPLCALLDDGSYVVIVKIDNDHYTVADINNPAAGVTIPIAELSDRFAGTYIYALPMLEDLQQRIIGEQHKSHWFWGSFRARKKVVFDVALGSLVANLFAVAVSLFALQVYDRVIPNHSESTLWVLGIGCGLAIMLETVLRVSRSYLIDFTGKSVELEVSGKLLEKFQGMRLSSRPASPGSLVHMVREFGSVREFFTSTSINSTADIPFVLIFLTLIYMIAGQVVWIVVAAMIVIVTPSLLAQKTMLRLTTEMQGGSAAASKLLTEIAYSHEFVKTNRAENHFQKKWEEINLLNASKTSEQRALAAQLTYWATGIQQAAYVTCIIAGVYMVFVGDFTVGTIIALTILCSRSLAPVTQIAGAISRWQQVRTSLNALDEIMHAEQERSSDRQFARRQLLNGDITLSSLNYAHTDDAPPFLQIEDLVIRKGTSVAVLGENGSGKSTLLKVLSGLYTGQQGTIEVDGMELRQIDPIDVRTNIAYLPQEVKLFSGTLRDNLLMGVNPPDDQLLLEALTFSGLDKLIASAPLGLDTEIHDGGEGMSVGQRQSLGLARLYLQDPQIVLLDEPTASLDQTLELQLVKKLEQWLQGRTCVIATHRIPILSVTARTIVMRNGRICMDGTTENVLKSLTVKRQPTEATAA